MLSPVKVVEIELSQPMPTLENLSDYMWVQALVRLYGVPLGYVTLPISNGRCTATTIAQKVLAEYSWAIAVQHFGIALQHNANGIITPDDMIMPDDLITPDKSLVDPGDLAQLLAITPPTPDLTRLPSVTVAVCTRDRTADLALCLDSLLQLELPCEILVVDNAPSNQATAQLVAQKYPQVRYVCEPRPGLDWARNRAIIEATGDVIAYADDDVVVDRGWTTALAQVFAESPEVMAVTGLVVPYELETEAQVLFEMNGGFGKGFERKQFYAPSGTPFPWYLCGTGNFGTGANMAYRRSVFPTIGGFNPALDVGTVTHGAGDLEMFLRIVAEGYVLIYEPRAIIRHRHRREYAQLKTQLTNNGSVFSYLLCAAQAYPQLRRALLKVGMWYFGGHHLRRAIMLSTHPNQFPKDLVWAEIKGCLVGLGRYKRADRAAIALARKFALDARATEHAGLFPAYFAKRPRQQATPGLPESCRAGALAVRTIELTQPFQPLHDVTDYRTVRVFVHYRGICRGSVDIYNQFLPVTVTQLVQAITVNLWKVFLWPDRELSDETRWQQVFSILQQHYSPAAGAIFKPESLPALVNVSVIVGTCDRPEDLRNCLRSLSQQETLRQFEIIVVDNNPRSGLTAPVVREFTQQFVNVRLVGETRQGVAYARNAGIAASLGEIIITTDDDVTMPSNWLETLVTPFVRADVMAVTGNILPVELEAPSQQFFEHYGGLGRGYKSFEVGRSWFEQSWKYVVRTWELGGTANAAFRASIFAHPQIGLMCEPLGPGMPSGVGEDIYLFYKILKAGYTIVYSGEAHVWHRHRDNMPALRHQLYNYSKGYVSYNLTTWLQDGDCRALLNIGFYLPLYHAKRIYNRLRRRSHYPIPLVLVEIAGNLMGPIALWRSWRRVKRQGRSQPYDRSTLPSRSHATEADIDYTQLGRVSRAESH